MYKIEKIIIKIILLGIIVTGIVFTILNFKNNNGDPLINLVFAKNFRKGFFYYGNEGPKSGSTSPLFVFLITPFYLIFRDPPLIIIKIFYFLLYLISGYFLVLIGRRLLEKNEFISYLLLSAYLGNIYFSYLVATLYDSILLFLCLIIFYYILFNINADIQKENKFSFKNAFLLSFFGFLSLMARPDSFIAIFISYVWLLFKVVKNKNLIKYFFLSAILLFLLAGGFYLFLGIQTNHLIPTSILARATLKSNGFINNIIKIFSSNFWVYYLLFGYLILCFLFFLLRDKVISRLGIDSSFINLMFIIICIYIPIFLYSSEVRYISGAFPSILIIAALFPLFCISILVKSSRIRFLLLFIFGFLIIYSFGAYKILTSLPIYSEDIIFEKSLCEILNKISQPLDKVAAYEIQAQYCLKPQVLSLDGIVGGEILPYFKNKTNLLDFFEKYQPSYLVLSNYVIYRKEYKDTILEELYYNDNKIKIGEIYKINNINFLKIAQNESDYNEKMKGIRFWLSLYKLSYD